MVRLHDHWDLFLLDLETGQRTQLTRSSALAGRAADNVSPAWSPDGRFIVFFSNRDGTWRMYIMAADGSGQRPFLEEALAGLTFTYQNARERMVHWGPETP
jgi:Tol biopolymer transport system component